MAAAAPFTPYRTVSGYTAARQIALDMVEKTRLMAGRAAERLTYEAAMAAE